MNTKSKTLTAVFSAVCSHIAQNMPTIILPNLDDDQEMATPLFEDAHIENINEWWDMDNHMPKFIAYLEGIERNVPGGMQSNIDSGLESLQEHPHLVEELRVIHDSSHSPTAAILKYIPHVAEYSDVLKNTDGYRALDETCQTMDNVIAWPMVTVAPNPKNLKAAFSLNVAILSTDGAPLKPKIGKLPRPSV